VNEEVLAHWGAVVPKKKKIKEHPDLETTNYVT
jgi:hypothetical protein